MDVKQLYDDVSRECSKIITTQYSTSFSLGIRCLDHSIHYPIYSIYGFVRVADEIVDSMHGYPQERLLDDFESQTYLALEDRISTNPILNSFQWVVHHYHIDRKWIDTFLRSMRMDLSHSAYTQVQYEEYILGSAEVVGLMCLHVFTDGDPNLFDELKPYAMRLGSAFQKVNFLRDIKVDSKVLGRIYFPNVEMDSMTLEQKQTIEREIQDEFDEALIGIKKLPPRAQFGVFLAYQYYQELLHQIQKTPLEKLLDKRIRVSGIKKIFILCSSYIRHKIHIW